MKDTKVSGRLFQHRGPPLSVRAASHFTPVQDHLGQCLAEAATWPCIHYLPPIFVYMPMARSLQCSPSLFARAS